MENVPYESSLYLWGAIWLFTLIYIVHSIPKGTRK